MSLGILDDAIPSGSSGQPRDPFLAVRDGVRPGARWGGRSPLWRHRAIPPASAGGRNVHQLSRPSHGGPVSPLHQRALFEQAMLLTSEGGLAYVRSM